MSTTFETKKIMLHQIATLPTRARKIYSRSADDTDTPEPNSSDSEDETNAYFNQRLYKIEAMKQTKPIRGKRSPRRSPRKRNSVESDEDLQAYTGLRRSSEYQSAPNDHNPMFDIHLNKLERLKDIQKRKEAKEREKRKIGYRIRNYLSSFACCAFLDCFGKPRRMSQ